jgi:hypothetical protein
MNTLVKISKNTHILQQYDLYGFIYFTFSKIIVVIKKGVAKKQLKGLPVWNSINKDNYLQYINKDHYAVAILCGEISNMTGIDFDNEDSYNQMVTDYPELKKYKTIKTNKGYHIYCLYNKNIKTTTNGLNKYANVDIRNDDSILIAPATNYKLL